jgi:hypothetical protein
MKCILLQQEHDPAQPQTYRVIQATASPVDSPSTWLSWWDGAAVPRPSHIASAEKLAHRSGELLDVNERRTCLCRHFVALDVLNTKFRLTGRPEDHRRAQAERLIAGLNEAWSSFLETSASPGRERRLDVLNELGHSADTLFDRCEIPNDRVAWAQKFGGNLARWALPSDAVFQHSWLEPLSIFRFLAMLAAWECLEDRKLIELWAIDLASATLAVRTLVESAGLRRPRFPTLRMGFAGAMHLIASSAFCAPRFVLDQPETLNVARNVYGDQAEIALGNLRTARDSYYDAFSRLGISESALRALNGTHWEKTWDGAFGAARARI